MSDIVQYETRGRIAVITLNRPEARNAVNGDVALLKQAVLHDPLTAAVCDPIEVWQMVDEMLVAQAKWLPQYKQAIPEAKRRLADAKRKGEYRGTWKWNGAARLHTKTVAEMKKKAAESRRLAAAADKAAEQRAKDAAAARKKRKAN